MGKALGIFEKYLLLWVFLCMLAGIGFSIYLPTVSVWLNEWNIGNVSVPIGICLFLMMYPALLNFQSSELKKLTKALKPILLTLVSNWVIAPLVAAGLAYYFLEGKDQLIVALILLVFLLFPLFTFLRFDKVLKDIFQDNKLLLNFIS